ncbi:MAG: PIG-L family deacetylase [Verrucomicrobia bacterium]|jgi:LmbE family N-acetylglucosaminyl deacetylase|nr:PIG-L family deacetylase [Verrucomicrobiota bacterium]
MKVLAAAAHPDDIEFMMAGTLLRLKDAGCEIHLWNLANGCCGSATLSRAEAAATRWQEAQASAKLAGGTAHPPLFDDLDMFYDQPSLAKVAAVVRAIQPDIILTQSPQDYMEDHQNTARLIVTAAFSRGMKNYQTTPAQPVYDRPVAVYHALPHGLKDGLRQVIAPHFYTDITAVLARKRALLACHASQKEWLDVSQGMDAYLNEMERLSREVGMMSGKFQFAEGWRRHSHLGFAGEDFDPLKKLLGGFISKPIAPKPPAGNP